MSIPIIIVRKHATPLGYEQIATVTTPKGLEPKGALVALIQAEGADFRWRDDGVNPTTTVGMPLLDGASMEYRGDMSAIRFITANALAVLNATYYGPEE